jgi:hypothetical protein
MLYDCAVPNNIYTYFPFNKLNLLLIYKNHLIRILKRNLKSNLKSNFESNPETFFRTFFRTLFF